ncbi:hypothetical protein GCM10027440_52860 [Nocardiopsis coralliicola]
MAAARAHRLPRRISGPAVEECQAARDAGWSAIPAYVRPGGAAAVLLAGSAGWFRHRRPQSGAVAAAAVPVPALAGFLSPSAG